LNGSSTPVDLRIGWLADHELVFAALRRCFTYAPADNRATGYLYADGEQDWPEAMAALGPWLIAELHQLLNVRFTVVAFQAYQDGNAWTDWHVDSAFGGQAILSLGATRTFGVGDDLIRVAAGDLIYLADHVRHSVRPDPEVTGERCSLVFRAPLGGECTAS